VVGLIAVGVHKDLKGPKHVRKSIWILLIL